MALGKFHSGRFLETFCSSLALVFNRLENVGIHHDTMLCTVRQSVSSFPDVKLLV